MVQSALGLEKRCEASGNDANCRGKFHASREAGAPLTGTQYDNKLNEAHSPDNIQRYKYESDSNVPLLFVKLMQSMERVLAPQGERQSQARCSRQTRRREPQVVRRWWHALLRKLRQL